jgi:hypothetical protein
MSWLPADRHGEYSFGPAAAKRGRGTTPTTHGHIVCAKNPADRWKLKLRFRRLARWSDARVRAALTLLCEYFEQLAQFDIVTNERIRLWCDALQIPGEPGGDYSAGELRHAIRAKAASLAPDSKLSFDDKLKRYGCPTPENFIARDKVRQWLQRSPQSQQERGRVARASAKFAQQAAESAAFEVFPDALRTRLKAAWNRRAEHADALKEWWPPGAVPRTAGSRESWKPGRPVDERLAALNAARETAVRRLRMLLSEHGAGDLSRDRLTEGLLLEFQLEELRR